jgi:hypothetical protein
MTENKYQLGKIYKLTSEHTNKIYIGSTCEKLSRRLICHISHHKRWKNGNGRYITSFVLFELGLVQITLLENCNCDTKNELLSKERYWIEHHRDIIVNKYIPTKTDEELREQRNELTKQYNNVNKYKITKKN